MDPSKPKKMGGLAQRFNLSQRNSTSNERPATPDQSGQLEFATNPSRPVQIPGSQVLRRNGGSDVLAISSETVREPLIDRRSQHFQHVTSFSAPRGPISMSNSAPVVPMEIDSPEITTPEQWKISDLEQRLRVATQKIQNLEDDAKAHSEELLVTKTQARIAIDQEIVRLQQEVETLGEHEDHLIRELVASETKLKDLKTTERDLRTRLSHFRTIYCLKHAFSSHLRKMNPIKQCAAIRLNEKFLETEGKYMKAAYELYDFLEVNGLEDTLPSDVKAMLAKTGNSD